MDLSTDELWKQMREVSKERRGVQKYMKLRKGEGDPRAFDLRYESLYGSKSKKEE